MKNIDILRARAEEIEAEFRSIDSEAGERSLNDEEQVRWDALDAELKQVREDLADAEVEAERAARVAESRAKWGSLQVSSRQDPFGDLDSVRRMSDDDPALIDRALSAVEKTEYRRLSYAVSSEARER
jgi:outer membrane PBP1 activator LpoA protein